MFVEVVQQGGYGINRQHVHRVNDQVIGEANKAVGGVVIGGARRVGTRCARSMVGKEIQSIPRMYLRHIVDPLQSTDHPTFSFSN